MNIHQNPPIKYIDFHCHLDLYPEPSNLIDECRREGVYILSVTTTPEAWNGNKKLLRNCSRIKPALGLHPQIVHQRKKDVFLFERLVEETRYVGEIGLDGSKGFRQYGHIQEEVFRHILKVCASSGGRIMSVHSRGAASDVLDNLEDFPDAGIPVLHWFSGNNKELKRAIDIGCWFSVGPAMMSSKKGRKIISQIPRDKVLTESDGPFTTMNKKPLTPLDMPKALKILADIWSASIEVAGQRVEDSFHKLLSE